MEHSHRINAQSGRATSIPKTTIPPTAKNANRMSPVGIKLAEVNAMAITTARGAVTEL